MKDIKEELVDALCIDIKSCILNGIEEDKESFKFIICYIDFIKNIKNNNININIKNIEDLLINEMHREIISYLGD